MKKKTDLQKERKRPHYGKERRGFFFGEDEGVNPLDERGGGRFVVEGRENLSRRRRESQKAAGKKIKRVCGGVAGGLIRTGCRLEFSAVHSDGSGHALCRRYLFGAGAPC